VVTYPLPIALLGLPFAPLPALTAAGIALGARLVVALTVARIAGNRPAALLLLPLRDCLSLAVFVASFVTRSVDWRGARLTIGGDGRMTVPTETRSR
jgi:ceramide glucosyltransferase